MDQPFWHNAQPMLLIPKWLARSPKLLKVSQVYACPCNWNLISGKNIIKGEIEGQQNNCHPKQKDMHFGTVQFWSNILMYSWVNVLIFFWLSSLLLSRQFTPFACFIFLFHWLLDWHGWMSSQITMRYVRCFTSRTARLSVVRKHQILCKKLTALRNLQTFVMPYLCDDFWTQICPLFLGPENTVRANFCCPTAGHSEEFTAETTLPTSRRRSSL